MVSALKIMLGSRESASFFGAVGLSGMGAGVIDTFLFIRCDVSSAAPFDVISRSRRRRDVPFREA